VSTTNAEANRDNAVAVIGAACRFPGSNNIDQFWKLLQAGSDPVSNACESDAHPNPDLP
jgi:acyl transferase domain-containing protein